MECDLLVIAGTSLKVTPFAHTVNMCHPKTPRVLINNEIVGVSSAADDFGLELNMSRNYRDVAYEGATRTDTERLEARGRLQELSRLQ